MDEGVQTMVFARGGGGGDEGAKGPLVFVFNWSPTESRADYIIEVPAAGKYRLVLSTDEERFGGQGRQSAETEHFSFTGQDNRHFIQIYNICRTAAVFALIHNS